MISLSSRKKAGVGTKEIKEKEKKERGWGGGAKKEHNIFKYVTSVQRDVVSHAETKRKKSKQISIMLLTPSSTSEKIWERHLHLKITRTNPVLKNNTKDFSSYKRKSVKKTPLDKPIKSNNKNSSKDSSSVFPATSLTFTISIEMILYETIFLI